MADAKYYRDWGREAAHEAFDPADDRFAAVSVGRMKPETLAKELLAEFDVGEAMSQALRDGGSKTKAATLAASFADGFYAGTVEKIFEYRNANREIDPSATADADGANAARSQIREDYGDVVELSFREGRGWSWELHDIDGEVEDRGVLTGGGFEQSTAAEVMRDIQSVLRHAELIDDNPMWKGKVLRIARVEGSGVQFAPRHVRDMPSVQL